MENKKSNKKTLIALAVILIVTAGVAYYIYASTRPATKESEGYTHITPEEAIEFVADAEENGAAIVDVRGETAWSQGHIPGAIAIWYEDFESGRVDELPDPDQEILLYCDYGGISKWVAEDLVEQGYTNVYEFDGMDYWTGEVIIEDETYKAYVESLENESGD